MLLSFPGPVISSSACLLIQNRILQILHPEEEKRLVATVYSIS